MQLLLTTSETVIEGSIVRINGAWEFDKNSLRIQWLTENALDKIGPDESGWNVIFRDPGDGRFWKLSYPGSEVQGAAHQD